LLHQGRAPLETVQLLFMLACLLVQTTAQKLLRAFRTLGMSLVLLGFVAVTLTPSCPFDSMTNASLPQTMPAI